ncbi:isopenicillin-N N-acyltransferase like protein [Bacillus sp. OV194]|nr:isopenicillin-N N-acyltransferase like protein [Bacillus sp. OV194]
MHPFPLIQVSGSALERGRQIGMKAKKQIVHNINTYKKIFMDMAGVDWATATNRAADYIPWIEKYDQEIMNEIIGISEGSNQPLLDIVALNSRSEIILNTDGCTSVAVLPEVTKNNETLLGQNWDWNDVIKPGIIILEIDQAPRPKILMATEAGIVGKIGMNSEGLGVCLNLLGTQNNTVGVPIHIVLRGILNSKSISQAVGQVARLRRGTAANFLVADDEGVAFDIESTCTDFDVLYPSAGTISHTNHFVSTRMDYLDNAREKFPDTFVRHWRSKELLSTHKSDIDEQTLNHLFTDHFGYPDSICRHGDLYPVDLGRFTASCTVFSIVMNLSKKTFEISTGQPCSSDHHTYRLSQLQLNEH